MPNILSSQVYIVMDSGIMCMYLFFFVHHLEYFFHLNAQYPQLSYSQKFSYVLLSIHVCFLLLLLTKVFGFVFSLNGMLLFVAFLNLLTVLTVSQKMLKGETPNSNKGKQTKNRSTFLHFVQHLYFIHFYFRHSRFLHSSFYTFHTFDSLLHSCFNLLYFHTYFPHSKSIDYDNNNVLGNVLIIITKRLIHFAIWIKMYFVPIGPNFEVEIFFL